MGLILSVAPVPAALADDVDVTVSTNNGLNLDSFTGTTARIFPGVTVANTGTLMPGGTFSGVVATTQPWTLTNQGIIDAQLGNAITFTQGGTVNNENRIDSGFNGIRIQSGGNVTNTAGAIVETDTSAVWVSGGGTLVNSGRLTSRGGATAVLFDGGGTVTNNVGARIEGSGGNALAIRAGTTRILTNHGTITDMSGGFATGAVMEGGTLTNSATGVISGSYNAIWAITGQPISIINAGQLTSVTSGAGAIELQQGGTVQNSGTIQGGFGIEVLPGFMVTDASTAVTNSGTVTGTDGTAIRFRAGTNSLTLQTGSVLNGNVVGGPNSDSLVLEGSGTEGINKFSNFETLSMQGTAWTLTGAGTFSTGSTVQSGVLMVDGQLTSPTVAVQSGGTLGGVGTVTGAVTLNGTIAPGNSIGTLNVVGPYTQAAGSTYRVEINPVPATDLINITGAATLQGGTVNVLAAPGTYTVGQRYTILTASGGVTGTYASLTDNAPFLDFMLFYDPNNVYLDVTRALAVTFPSVAQTPNQKAAASGAERLGPGNPIFDAILNLNTANALQAFDLLSGEIHATIRTVLTDDSRFVRDGILGRLRQFAGTLGFGGPQIVSRYADEDDGGALAYAARKRSKVAAAGPFVTKAEPAPERRWALWGSAFGSWGKGDGDGNAATANNRTGGFISGVDTTIGGAFGSALRVGIAGAYQGHSIKVSDRNSSADIDSYHLAAYAALLNGSFALRTGISHGWHEIETSRNIIFPGFSDTAKGRYDGGTTQLFGEIGYALAYGTFALEPYAGLAYVRVSADGFTENGGAAALTALGADTGTTFSTLGLRAALPLATAWNTTILKGGLGWRHAFNATTPNTALAFAGGTPFTVAGVPIARDALLVEAGFDMAWSPDTTVSLGYTGQYAGSAGEHGVKGRAVRRF